MKFYLSIIFVLNIILLSVSAQPNINWQNTIGGSGYDNLMSSDFCFDRGLILGGYSRSAIGFDKTDTCRGGDDFWIVKIDSSGIVQWDKTFGGTNDDVLFSVKQTADSGFILAGRTESDSTGDMTIHSNGSEDIWVIKLDSYGNIEWQKCFGGNDYEDAGVIMQTLDGGFILGSTSSSNISGNKTENRIGINDYWIIKMDSLGIIQWQNTIGGSDLEEFVTVLQTNDNGYIIGGYSKSDISGDKTTNSHNHGEDYWIVKLDSSGLIQWQKTIGGNDIEQLVDLIRSSDGGYIICGNSYSGISGEKNEPNRGLSDIWVVKLTAMGNIQWQKTLGGDNQDFANSIIENSNGFLIGGYSYSDISGDKTEQSIGLDDFWLIQLTSSGSILWDKTVGGTGSDVLRKINNVNNEVFFCGSSTSNISGDKTQNCKGLSDFWIIGVNIINGINSIVNDNFNIYPNPFNEKLIIDLNNNKLSNLYIVNSMGEVVIKCDVNFRGEIETNILRSGLYIIRLISSNEMITIPIIKN